MAETVDTLKSRLQGTEPADGPDLSAPELYFNRELSHLQFNVRVLNQAMDESHPLLNRLMFACIFSSNMDEFFEIRVAGFKQQIKYGRETVGPDGLTPQQILERVAEEAHVQIERQYTLLNDVLLPALEKEGIYFLRRSEWTEEQRAWIESYFDNEVRPVINPIGLDPSHPFPRLVNKSLNFITELEGRDAFGRENGLAIVPAPRSLPRLVKLPDELSRAGTSLVFLSSIIHEFAGQLFPGMTVKGMYQFRLTRNADLVLEEDDMEDLAKALRGELLSRRFGDAVRLEIADNCPENLEKFLLDQFGLQPWECYRVAGPVNLARLMAVPGLVNRPDLMYPPFTPGLPASLRQKEDLFAQIARQDILLLHPFQSFSPVVDLLRQAARDPDVLAIRQTLYRTGSQSEVVAALVEAARRGKEVTVVIELRARFDEESNLELASRLQEAGVIVVYGVVGYKTHCKLVHIVRREKSGLKGYAHLGTGNYHAANARLYTDYSLLTADRILCEDVNRIFLQLTGMTKAMKIRKLMHAPFTLHERLLAMIEREADNARAGRPAFIRAKVNALTEPRIIQALYRASRAGVEIDLVIRGICCLRPGVEGVSDTIRVRSIVGRFLEHTRVYWFHNDGKDEVYCGSADWMERNLLNRVEVGFPIEDARLSERIRLEFEAYLKDNQRAWVLNSDGSYSRVVPAEEEAPFDAQQFLLTSLAAG
ncbi:polyphosphate kinase 1 [Hahella sp. SMD15-11]|uniref:Polyphosphate kinase n=1 Tax=Thermohahella caldifontis TaxID=3142973 RepID=A0AB39UW97_9GAMM